MEVIVDENAMEAEVKEAYNKLVKAYLDLRLVPDKSKLEELVNKAEEIDTSRYTKESVNAFNTKLKEAKVVLSNEDAIQEEINKASEGLELAIGNLELAQGNGNGSNGNEDGNGNVEKGDAGNSDNNSGNNSNKLPSTGGSSSATVGLFGVIVSLIGVFVLKRRKQI